VDRRIDLTCYFGENVTLQKTIELAQRAEALGYDTLWVGEAWGRDAFTSLTNLACHTSRVKLATGVVNIHSRPPSTTAQSIASLDEISGGRAVLGLGAGSPKIAEDWHGVPFDKPVERMREYVQVVRAMLAGQRMDHHGTFYHAKDFRMAARTVQERLPVYLAALGPRMVELVGESADGWLPNYVAPRYLPVLRARIEAGAARMGRKAADIMTSYRIITCASGDGEQARAAVRQDLGFVIGAYGPFYRDLVARAGFAEEAAHIRTLWETDRKRVASGVTEAMLDALTVAGTPEECRQRYDELRALGLQAINVSLPLFCSPDLVRETIEALGPVAFDSPERWDMAR